MKKNLLRLFSVLGVVSLSALHHTPAVAVTLDFVPPDQTVSLGSPATVNIVVSDPAGALVAAFDFFVNYDPAILAFDSVAFGPSLGGPDDSLVDVVESPLGSVNVAELSLIVDLTDLQDGVTDLLLFSITFDSLAVGVGPLSFGENILGVAGGFLGDELGQPIALDGTTTGSITVVPGMPMPEPTTVLLMVIGIVGLSIFKGAPRI